MMKTYTHNAIYFAFSVFLSVSIGAISPVYAQSADVAAPATVPKLKKKTSKRVVEEVVEAETETKPAKTVFVRRRKDPIVLPRVNPFVDGAEGAFELAQLGPHQELPDENADNEASSTVELDEIETSSVVLDQDQPQDSNISAAAGAESAANVDETALLKAEIESLKAQLLSEKKKSAKLTVDLVRAKETASEPVDAKQGVEAEETDVVQDVAAEAASQVTDVAGEEKEPDTAQSVTSENQAAAEEVVTNTQPDEAAKIEETKAAEVKAAEVKAAEVKAAETSVLSDAVDSGTAKLADVTKEVATTPEPTEETQTSKQDAETAEDVKEEKKVALAPAESVEREVEKAAENASNPDAANASLNEGEEVAEVDPALLLPFPRENPFPRVVPKVAKGPLYIKLPPVNDTYNMYVLGDSLGSGLWQGLHQNFRGAVAPAIKVVKKAKANTGIVRSDRFDWMENVEKIANGGGFQIAVLMFGANDAQTIRLKGKRHHFGTPAWEQIYRQRIDRMILALKRKKVAIYWVGLPNVRVPSLRKNYIHFNAIFKEKAEEHGIHFVETWDVTNDASGKWQSFGKTVLGKKAVLRAKDGTHFTSAGYRLLAQFPEDVLRPDINQARANRLAKGL